MKTFAKAPLAMAIAALLAAPYALATTPIPTPEDDSYVTDSTITSDWTNTVDVSVSHTVTNAIDVDLDVTVDDPADHFSAATIDRKQISGDNIVNDHAGSTNNATINNSGNGATGNIGVNMASGGLNSQANDAAISKGSEGTTTTTFSIPTPLGPVSGSKNYDAMVFAKAATFSLQSGSNNEYNTGDTTNAARVTDSFNNASGNLGVNMAAGFGNAQNNGMTLAAGQNSSAEATIAGVQSVDNTTLNAACGCGDSNTSTLSNSFQRASGNVGVNVASGNANMQSNNLSIARSK
ncbi:hypothetical protein SAMN04487958_101517 [Vreelandella subterranea]|uniref:Curlin associated repeat-containing protein n=1 Tax=Vreelandella subterranea TaxID=416874 RepID=A0A1H9Q450_9GAMM|nr:hypothetical protein [Halomonas subterranea]SER54653.1 hypothetical protein SAMN04487958_101517 [Halomonas subterranea]